RVPVAHEDAAHESAERILVLHDEDGLAATTLGGGLHATRLHVLLVGGGQEDAKGRSAAGLRIDVDRAARALDDAVDGGEAEPGALAGLLGGEEGLEEAG